MYRLDVVMHSLHFRLFSFGFGDVLIAVRVASMAFRDVLIGFRDVWIAFRDVLVASSIVVICIL
jgi:hypothetical protein